MAFRKFENNITVLICVHSSMEMHDVLLDMALQSLTEQTFKDFRVLIVADSCKRAETYQIIDKYKDALDISVLGHEKSGLANAKNFGIDRILTDWVAYLDADDMYLPDKLQKQIDFLSNHIEIDILGTHYFFVKHNMYYDAENKFHIERGTLEKSCFEDNTYITHEEISNRIFEENVIGHGTVLMPTKIVKEIPYDTTDDWKGKEDWQLWKDCIKAGYKFANLPERLYVYSIGTSVAR